MGLKNCEECGEQVDEAKAFCPECGNSFIEEKKREESSEFDDYAGTMNFSSSTYKLMLSEMELDTTQATGEEQKEIKIKALNTEKPAEVETSETTRIQVDLPEEDDSFKQREKQKIGNKNWLIFAAIGSVVLLVFLLIILAVILFVLKG